MRNSIKTTLALLLVLVLCIGSVNSAYAAKKQKKSEEEILKERESYTHVVNILGKNYLVFAQNSPEWYELYADDKKDSTRMFGPSGCVVGSFANVVVNSLPYSRLSEITSIMRTSPKIDTRGLTRNNGKSSGRFEIKNDSDFLRYWPLVVGNYAAGNNQHYSYVPMQTGFYHYLTDFYGIRMEVKKNWRESLNYLNEGAMVITCSSGSSSPFSKIGHYFVFVAMDDEYVYIIDSYFRDSFPLDKKHIVEYVEPGVERIKISNLHKMQIETQYVIWPDENATVYDAEMLKEIIDASNAHQ